MPSFKFLHAADLHLDSPLLGLSAKSAAFAERVDQASRRAFDNLVELAIAEGCRFVVLAGDTFDGDLRHYGTGLFFVAGVRRLREAGIRVFMIAGNHDAENRWADKLDHADNLHRFSHRKAETVVMEELDVAVHGRSFGQREVLENIALGYPAPHPNRFNIGVLHTACAGSEGEHAAYAPCSLEQLVRHEYQYWALGHVHGRAVLHTHPHVVYPGNLQGRSPREIGAKGATLVEVADGAVVACVHRDLDEIRWAVETVDLSDAIERSEILAAVRRRLEAVCAEAGERPVALRLRLAGASSLHSALLRERFDLRQDIDAMMAAVSDTLWLEKLELATRPAAAPAPGVDPTVAGQLAAEVRRAGSSPEIAALMEDYLAEIQVRMPAGARMEALFHQVRAEAPARAVDLALSLVEDAEAGRAPQ